MALANSVSLKVSHDGYICAPECPVRMLGEQSGTGKPTGRTRHKKAPDGMFVGGRPGADGYSDSGTAARFFKTFSEEESLNLFTRTDTRAEVLEGDCVEKMAEMEEDSIDAIVCDPPYGLEFMGKAFDKLGKGAAQELWHYRWAVEAFRVLKPGGHMLAFGGTRTYHRMVCAIEDAGFEIKDSISWVYGSGFPKSHNVEKSLRKLGEDEAADTFVGFGSALKPAHEPIALCRKPLSESSIARNVLEHSTGGLNIDGCRVGNAKDVPASISKHAARNNGVYEGNRDGSWGNEQGGPGSGHDPNTGRFPANLILSHSPECVRIGEKRVKGDGAWPAKRSSGAIFGEPYGEEAEIRREMADPDGKERVAAYECARDEAGNHICPVALMDEQSGIRKSDFARPTSRAWGVSGEGLSRWESHNSAGYNDSGGASRFFQQFHEPDTGAGFKYIAKAAKRERNLGLSDFLPRTKDSRKRYRQDVTGSFKARAKNRHSTVKPQALMSYLCRLITPPGGTVLDPFCGSGTTGVAAVKEGFNFVGIEMEMPSVITARARIEYALSERQPKEQSPHEGLFSLLEEPCPTC